MASRISWAASFALAESAFFSASWALTIASSAIRQWFRTIDKEVGGLLSDAQSPLVLAGVDTLFPLYKEVNTHPHLMEEGIPGNPEGMKTEDLHQQAWAIVEPVFRKKREAGSARYR
jgi:hypothetical protein